MTLPTKPIPAKRGHTTSMICIRVCLFIDLEYIPATSFSAGHRSMPKTRKRQETIPTRNPGVMGHPATLGILKVDRVRSRNKTQESKPAPLKTEGCGTPTKHLS